MKKEIFIYWADGKSSELSSIPLHREWICFTEVKWKIWKYLFGFHEVSVDAGKKLLLSFYL